jgi:hypothetical protein
MFLCLSSGTRARYRQDVLRALAMPLGTELQFRYDLKWIAPKSECTRFVHSCGDLDSRRCSDVLDRSGDLGCIIELGPFGEPGSVLTEVPLDIADDITQALPLMVARALSVHVANSSLKGIRLGTRGRQPSPYKAGMAFDPLPHSLSLMNTGGIHAPRETGDPWSWIRVIQACQQVTEESMGLPCAAAMEYLAGGEMQGPSQIVRRVLAGCHDCLVAPVGPPGRADLGPQVEVECIGKHHHLMRLPRLGMQPPTGHAFDPLGIVILGDQRRPCPHPSHLVEPAAHGPRGDFKAVCGLEFHGQRGATPPPATPAVGMRCGLE